MARVKGLVAMATRGSSIPLRSIHRMSSNKLAPSLCYACARSRLKQRLAFYFFLFYLFFFPPSSALLFLSADVYIFYAFHEDDCCISVSAIANIYVYPVLFSHLSIIIIMLALYYLLKKDPSHDFAWVLNFQNLKRNNNV